jgi:Fungal chitosanase of glycosyl hydrolase group 75
LRKRAKSGFLSFKSKTDINRYINSESVNYVALPGGRDIGARSLRAQGARLGDLVAVINTLNYKVSFAEYADVGPRNKWGEGSIALANSLNINSSPRIGGQEDGIVYVVFPRSGSGRPLSAEEIQSIGKAKLQEWIKIQGVGNVLNK